MRTTLRLCVLSIMCAGLCLFACSEAEPSGPHTEPLPTSTSQALSGEAQLRADGSVVITLADFGLLPPLPEDYCLEHEGRCIGAGERIPVARLHVPAGLSLPLVATDGALPEGVRLEWWHEMLATDPADPLCQQFSHRDHDGDVQCGERWVGEEVSVLPVDGGRVAISALDLRPGGAVDIEVELTKFEAHDPHGRTYYCCGEQRFVVRGTFDDALRAPLVEVARNGSMRCDYPSLDEVPSRAECPI